MESWQSFEETSGYVRPERVNKWPNSMTDTWWWWWWLYISLCSCQPDTRPGSINKTRGFLLSTSVLGSVRACLSAAPNTHAHRTDITTMKITNNMQQLFRLLIILIQTYMFRATTSPILRSTFWLHMIGYYIQGVTGGTDQTSGECSLGQTIPI